MAGNVCFYYTAPLLLVQFMFFPLVHMLVPPNQSRNPNKNPDFYDTCDAGVLIGKLPCTESTLAQSVANIPGRR